MNRELRNSNLSKYRVPISINLLYEYFVSHSYEARRAMRKINLYFELRKSKKELFRLDGTSESFIEFAKVVGVETRSAHVWMRTI